MVTTGAFLATALSFPSTTAAACPDVEVVFARGTTEPPGVGGVGQAFVDSLRSQVGGRSVGVYPVNYPATNDFGSSIAAGANDASAHVQSTAANCPNTRMVLGGYSQGAAVVDVITAAMPPDVADNVAAVAVFGNPSPAGSLSRRLWSGSLAGNRPAVRRQDHRPVHARRSDLHRRREHGAARSVRAVRNDKSGSHFRGRPAVARRPATRPRVTGRRGSSGLGRALRHEDVAAAVALQRTLLGVGASRAVPAVVVVAVDGQRGAAVLRPGQEHAVVAAVVLALAKASGSARCPGRCSCCPSRRRRSPASTRWRRTCRPEHWRVPRRRALRRRLRRWRPAWWRQRS